ncbi:MAG TPA: polysaccharide deacetylase family protein [Longimicrobiaceae bacterium]|nr:polysaccharide deacetylase family protein [Longimicrobiaceae bacterium]
MISLDFELHWGVRDKHAAASGYTASLLGAREAIPRMLDLFTEYGISATWATVGFLFAESSEELQLFHPEVRPAYEDTRLDPYAEPVGPDEARDPIHFAPTLIRLIDSAPGQEVATHTYSHFYCLEAGAGEEAFRQDIASAQAIARARGIDLRSIVLPRNQWNPRFKKILSQAGLECYRGNQPGWMYEASSTDTETRLKRLSRLIDAHVPLTDWGGARWRDLTAGAHPRDVPATCFLRSVSQGSGMVNRLRLRRITAGLDRAAREGRLFHLWWHPHNFGSHTTENLCFLRSVLDQYRRLVSEQGMRSLTMLEASRCPAPPVALTKVVSSHE